VVDLLSSDSIAILELIAPLVPTYLHLRPSFLAKPVAGRDHGGAQHNHTGLFVLASEAPVGLVIYLIKIVMGTNADGARVYIYLMGVIT
jgi:hypothetical protein